MEGMVWAVVGMADGRNGMGMAGLVLVVSKVGMADRRHGRQAGRHCVDVVLVVGKWDGGCWA